MHHRGERVAARWTWAGAWEPAEANEKSEKKLAAVDDA
jgi:hypothetical protein